MADTLLIRHPASGAETELTITDASIRAAELRRFNIGGEPLATFDPGFTNTAACHSAITYIDGDAGVLEYRGYPIATLAEHSTYLEVAYLLLNGELPTATELTAWEDRITTHRRVPEELKTVLAGFPASAHPMTILMSSVAAFFSFYPDARNFDDPASRSRAIARLIAKMPTLAAYAFRKGRGEAYVAPEDDLGYCANFLHMLFAQPDRPYEEHQHLVRAMEVLFILHADHEQNCSTNAVRSVASSGNDLFTCCSAGIGALHGPLHGGANEAVLKMLREIGSVDRVGEFIEGVKAGRTRMMGFGHRVYKNYDPRAKIIKSSVEDVFEITGVNPLLKIALELERYGLDDEYFVSRRLYPNVDFYSGLIYEALGFPPEMFTVLFAVPRASGWAAQYQEFITDPEQKIARPKQIYTGHSTRDYVPIGARG
ncbi:MAG: citrate synthase [Propionicimonas sp.]|uniref:citrate synthase n=1 Tax=Propionicimonas sp. TaxID=1955623 RepID=UPI001DE5EAD3|nr:citrate synthase [Propionicimonas sp.]MBU4187719.1 citrate synthase [Actinomycetota bacterium]MBU4206705.1 citrate synthase [Actinomycetota bacterium]MBU4249016.1 citrate synthase [Actinomycetota bacterium]MBU4363804.1 citrate synthase [Actinomycetota bacterium]MBU4409482.1 citrate synthase [Actinomycetota bacterium]